MFKLLAEQFGPEKSLEVNMDDEEKKELLIDYDEPIVTISFYFKDGFEIYDDEDIDPIKMDFYSGFMSVSEQEARNLMHCLQRVLDWDEEFENSCADNSGFGAVSEPG